MILGFRTEHNETFQIQKLIKWPTKAETPR